MKQIYLPIKGWEGFYEISNKGKVKSLPRLNARGRKIKGRILKPKLHHRYNYVSASVLLYRNGKGKEVQISRLVAQAFIPNPENKEEVNHKDFDATNNIVTNLEWMSHRQNMDYSKEAGRFKTVENSLRQK